MRYLWVTRALTSAEVAYAASRSIALHITPLIHTQYNLSLEGIQEKLHQLPQVAAWFFTSAQASQRAVEFLAQYTSIPPVIWAVGAKTAIPLQDAGYRVDCPAVATAAALGTAAQLAGIRSAVHWCGNLRRPELAESYPSPDHHLWELEVYDTVIPTSVASAPDWSMIGAIGFWSPSAVSAFQSRYGAIPAEIPLLAIGPTTHQAIASHYLSHLVLTAQLPSSNAMIDLFESIAML
jgi:uroporphyrinogen-III synthase